MWTKKRIRAMRESGSSRYRPGGVFLFCLARLRARKHLVNRIKNHRNGYSNTHEFVSLTTDLCHRKAHIFAV